MPDLKGCRKKFGGFTSKWQCFVRFHSCMLSKWNFKAICSMLSVYDYKYTTRYEVCIFKTYNLLLLDAATILGPWRNL